MIAWSLMAVLLFGADVPDFDTFFKEFAEKRANVQVLEARFEQKTILPEEVLTTRGKLLYAEPRRIVFRTEDPDRVTLIDDRRGYEYEAEVKQLVIFDVSDQSEADIFFLGFDADTEALREAYDVTLFATEDEPLGDYGIRVAPKKDATDPYFIEVNLFLRNEDYLPYRIHIVNDEESQVVLDVTDFKVNGAPDPSETQIILPEGTKIIENERVLETVGETGKRLPEPIVFAPERFEGDPVVEESELLEPAPAEVAP